MIKINSTNLPKGKYFKKLNEFETNDYSANVCVSCWEYISVLLDFKDNGTIPDRAMKVLKELYKAGKPIITDEIKDALQEKDKIVIQGAHGLGGFAHKFYDAFKEKYPNHSIELQTGKGKDCVYTEMFVSLIKMNDKLFYLVLRDRFRAALTFVLGDDVDKW